MVAWVRWWSAYLAIDDPCRESLDVSSRACSSKFHTPSIPFRIALHVVDILQCLLSEHLNTWFIHRFIPNKITLSTEEAISVKQDKSEIRILTCFCSKQCEHQNAPYILAPMALSCFARLISFALETVATSGSMGGKSISPGLMAASPWDFRPSGSQNVLTYGCTQQIWCAITNKDDHCTWQSQSRRPWRPLRKQLRQKTQQPIASGRLCRRSLRKYFSFLYSRGLQRQRQFLKFASLQKKKGAL